MSRARIVLIVSAAWAIVAVVAALQTSLSAALMPMPNGLPLPVLLRAAFVQGLPALAVSLVSVALTVRFPLNRQTWRRHLFVHIAAVITLAFLASMVVVLGYWSSSGQYRGMLALLRTSARWALIRVNGTVFFYGGVLAITQLVLNERRARTQELALAKIEGQLARAHVQALNAQIRPHFLFNTLHTIGQLWRSGRNDEAEAVLDHLGALFHKVQASTSHAAIPLAEELAIVREYVAIEQVRYGDRLSAEISAPDDVLDCPVPPLILQPIVENAVRHGISAVSTAGHLAICASRVGNGLRLSVHDDGPGPFARAGHAGSGTGIRNTRERLAQMYGSESSFEIEGDAMRGTTVTIRIPMNGNTSDAS